MQTPAAVRLLPLANRGPALTAARIRSLPLTSVHRQRAAYSAPSAGTLPVVRTAASAPGDCYTAQKLRPVYLVDTCHATDPLALLRLRTPTSLLHPLEATLALGIPNKVAAATRSSISLCHRPTPKCRYIGQDPRRCLLLLPSRFLLETLWTSEAIRHRRILLCPPVLTVPSLECYLGALRPSLSHLAPTAWPYKALTSVSSFFSSPSCTPRSRHVACKPVVCARRWHRARGYYSRHSALSWPRCARAAWFRHRRVPGPDHSSICQPISILTKTQGQQGYWITAYRTLTSVRRRIRWPHVAQG